MTLDLNRILLYANPDGSFRTTPKRNFSLIDGIQAMEGNEPVAGTPVDVGFLVAGHTPPAVGVVCTQLMGLNYSKIPTLHRAFGETKYPFALFTSDAIRVHGNEKALQDSLADLPCHSTRKFKAHFGWKGHVEL
jgi:uncharacterized protein (DUF362 family)